MFESGGGRGGAETAYSYASSDGGPVLTLPGSHQRAVPRNNTLRCYPIVRTVLLPWLLVYSPLLVYIYIYKVI